VFCRLTGFTYLTVYLTNRINPDIGINFTFMLPCVVIEFFLNNQQDALIIQIYFFFLLALQTPSGVVFHSPLAGFSLLPCEVS